MNKQMKFLTILLAVISPTFADFNNGFNRDYPYSNYPQPDNGHRRLRDRNTPPIVSSPPYNEQQLTSNPMILPDRLPDRSPTLNQAQDPRYEPKASEFVARTVMNLAYTIGRQLAATNNLQGAHVFSPMSIATALSLILLGSNGRTHQELLQFFGYDNEKYFQQLPYKIHEEFGMLIEDVVADSINPYRYRPDTPWRLTDKLMNDPVRGDVSNNNNYQQVSDYHKIHVANGIFVQNGYSLRPDYIAAVKSVYRSEMTSLDFQRQSEASKNYINEWVNTNTFGKIPNIISGNLKQDTNLIMASALYFKALWDNEFIGAASVVSDFFPDGPRGQTIKVNMMANGGIFPFYESKECNCKLIGLPYKGNLTTMYIFQPYDSTRQKLKDFQVSLTPAVIDDMISKMTKKTAVLAFPKLHIQNSFNLRDIFRELGYGTTFSSRESDLSLIADTQVPQYYRPQSPQLQRPQRPVPITQNRPPQQTQYRPITDRININNVQDLNNRLTFSNRFGGENDTQTTNVTDSEAIMTETTESNTTTNTNLNDEEEEIVPETTTEKLDENLNNNRSRRAVTYKVESNLRNVQQPLTFKDLVINKRITKLNPDKKLYRNRRQIQPSSTDILKRIDMLRNSPNLQRPALFVDDIIHKVDLVVNEQGTEGGAASITYLRRSGTDSVMRADTPFLILIRHDTTKIPLFYGAVYEPTLA